MVQLTVFRLYYRCESETGWAPVPGTLTAGLVCTGKDKLLLKQQNTKNYKALKMTVYMTGRDNL